MTSDDVDYYLRRARQERERAETSAEPDVANIHLALARLYEQRIADPAAWATLSTQKIC